MIRRNPAFRIAMGGLIVSVLLCLVGAISLVSSTPRVDVAEADTPSATETSTTEMPIQVASAGDAHGLLKDHPQKPVPEPVEYPAAGHAGKVPAETAPVESGPPSLPTEEQAETAPAAVSPVTAMETEIAQLKGQVSELARTQLENQLAEIRHAEQLLSAHQTHRLIEELQRDVDELKAERKCPPATSEKPEKPVDSGQEATTAAPREVPLPTHDEEGTPLATRADHSPAKSAAVPAPTPKTPRVRCEEMSDAAGRYRVDADDAPLPEFLAQLSPLAGWNLVSSSELQGSVTCRWVGVDLPAALTHLLRVRGWQVRYEGEFAIVEPLGKEAEKPDATPAPPIEAVQASAPVTLELAQERHEGSTYDQTTGILIQPRQTSKSFDQRPRIVTRLDTPPAQRPAPPALVKVSKSLDIAPPSLMKLEPPQPTLEIEATFIQLSAAPAAQFGRFREAIAVSGRGACPQCNQVHSLTDRPLGHTVEGWFELSDGVSCGVCSTSPELIVSQLQKLSTATVIATRQVPVLSGQQAEIGLTEQQGFRRLMDRGTAGGQQIGLLEGGLQLSLRPTLTINGSIQLEVGSPATPTVPATAADSPSTDPRAKLTIPADSGVVVGGLYFDTVTASPSNASTDPPPTAQTIHEVVVLIRVRPTATEARSAENAWHSHSPILPPR